MAGLELLVWALLVSVWLFSAAGPEAKSVNRDAAYFATAIVGLSGAPALVLALLGSWLRSALILALLPWLLFAGYVLLAV